MWFQAGILFLQPKFDTLPGSITEKNLIKNDHQKRGAFYEPEKVYLKNYHKRVVQWYEVCFLNCPCFLFQVIIWFQMTSNDLVVVWVQRSVVDSFA